MLIQGKVKNYFRIPLLHFCYPLRLFQTLESPFVLQTSLHPLFQQLSYLGYRLCYQLCSDTKKSKTALDHHSRIIFSLNKSMLQIKKLTQNPHNSITIILINFMQPSFHINKCVSTCHIIHHNNAMGSSVIPNTDTELNNQETCLWCTNIHDNLHLLFASLFINLSLL